MSSCGLWPVRGGADGGGPGPGMTLNQALESQVRQFFDRPSGDVEDGYDEEIPY